MSRYTRNCAPLNQEVEFEYKQMKCSPGEWEVNVNRPSLVYNFDKIIWKCSKKLRGFRISILLFEWLSSNESNIHPQNQITIITRMMKGNLTRENVQKFITIRILPQINYEKQNSSNIPRKYTFYITGYYCIWNHEIQQLKIELSLNVDKGTIFRTICSHHFCSIIKLNKNYLILGIFNFNMHSDSRIFTITFRVWVI